LQFDLLTDDLLGDSCGINNLQNISTISLDNESVINNLQNNIQHLKIRKYYIK
jgi:hypothetical protein